MDKRKLISKNSKVENKENKSNQRPNNVRNGGQRKKHIPMKIKTLTLGSLISKEGFGSKLQNSIFTNTYKDRTKHVLSTRNYKFPASNRYIKTFFTKTNNVLKQETSKEKFFRSKKLKKIGSLTNSKFKLKK
jgi:hypothetical protein